MNHEKCSARQTRRSASDEYHSSGEVGNEQDLLPGEWVGKAPEY
jgi:hypothetical protein